MPVIETLIGHLKPKLINFSQFMGYVLQVI